MECSQGYREREASSVRSIRSSLPFSQFEFLFDFNFLLPTPFHSFIGFFHRFVSMSGSVTYSMYLCYRVRDARDDPRPVIESNERKIFFKYANKNSRPDFLAEGCCSESRERNRETERHVEWWTIDGRVCAPMPREGGRKKQKKYVGRPSSEANDLSKRE